MKKYNVAIVGIDLPVARQIINFFNERNFPINFIKPLVAEHLQERYISFQGADYVIDKARDSLFRGMDFIFSVDDKFTSIIANNDGIIIDSRLSSRKDKEIPLIIPEVNSGNIRLTSKIFATPSPNSIFLAFVLKPIYNRVGLKKVIASIHQPASEKLQEHTEKIDKYNYTQEEVAIEEEVKRLIGEPQLAIYATCFSSPDIKVNILSVHIETKKKITADEAREGLFNTRGIKILDNIKGQIYSTMLTAEGKNEIFVGRIRTSYQQENCIDLMIAGDALRKGSALNMVHIAEEVIKIRERNAYQPSYQSSFF